MLCGLDVLRPGQYLRRVREEIAPRIPVHQGRRPFGKDTLYCPPVSQLQFDRIMGYIDSGEQKGGKVFLSGGRYANKGCFIEPTIFAQVKPDANIARE